MELSRRKGLGLEFLAAYEYALAQIMGGPDRWPLKAENIRRHRTKRFPYGIYFAIDGGLVRILAICHFHRDELNWRSRLKH
jgi:hypothetical protein